MGFVVYSRAGRTLALFRPMNGRLIAIGDIHGCHVEFSELLARLSPTREDRVILLGDLVNRGPDSARVVDLAREIGAVSLLGNHELRLLRYRQTGDARLLKESDLETSWLLAPEHWKYLESMVLTFEEPALNTVFVHGGFLPGQPWRDQPAEVVTRIQVVDRGRPAKRADAPKAPLWADVWSGPPYVVYGHTPRSHIYRLKWSVGIDTACVMGGHLTALVLPERRYVQVRARQRYWS
jgi:serine/threonine protein phosphatase 1